MKTADLFVAAAVGAVLGLIGGYLTFSLSWHGTYISMWFATGMVWTGDWLIWAIGGAILASGLVYIFHPGRKFSN
jgi:hypothetical protein